MTPGEPGTGYSFSTEEYLARLRNVRAAMRQANVDILLVTGSANIYYLSNYQNSGQDKLQCLVIPLDGEPQFVLRKLYFTAVAGLSWIKGGTPVGDTESHFDALVSCLERMGAGRARVGYDHQALSLPPGVLDGLRATMREATLVPAGGLVEGCRVIKSPAELAYIRRAAKLSVFGLEAAIAEVRPGASENDLAAAAYDTMVRAGSEYVSCQPIVVAGSRTPPRRGLTEGRPLRAGESVWYEASASVRRYGGPIMRTMSVGQPSAELRRVSGVMIAALNAILETAGPGVTCGDVDRAARAVVEKTGLGDHWLHRTGYSVGVSFPPSWTEDEVMDIKGGDRRVLRPGMAFHTVPWVLLPGIGSVGNSETWAVTEHGIEVLTETPRELRVCG